ncbi:hypothetical protein COBT_001315 [Conglomerata obtusa]
MSVKHQKNNKIDLCTSNKDAVTHSPATDLQVVLTSLDVRDVAIHQEKDEDAAKCTKNEDTTNSCEDEFKILKEIEHEEKNFLDEKDTKFVFDEHTIPEAIAQDKDVYTNVTDNNAIKDDYTDFSTQKYEEEFFNCKMHENGFKDKIPVKNKGLRDKKPERKTKQGSVYDGLQQECPKQQDENNVDLDLVSNDENSLSYADEIAHYKSIITEQTHDIRHTNCLRNEKQEKKYMKNYKIKNASSCNKNNLHLKKRIKLLIKEYVKEFVSISDDTKQNNKLINKHKINNLVGLFFDNLNKLYNTKIKSNQTEIQTKYKADLESENEFDMSNLQSKIKKLKKRKINSLKNVKKFKKNSYECFGNEATNGLCNHKVYLYLTDSQIQEQYTTNNTNIERICYNCNNIIDEKDIQIIKIEENNKSIKKLDNVDFTIKNNSNVFCSETDRKIDNYTSNVVKNKSKSRYISDINTFDSYNDIKYDNRDAYNSENIYQKDSFNTGYIKNKHSKSNKVTHNIVKIPRSDIDLNLKINNNCQKDINTSTSIETNVYFDSGSDTKDISSDNYEKVNIKTKKFSTYEDSKSYTKDIINDNYEKIDNKNKKLSTYEDSESDIKDYKYDNNENNCNYKEFERKNDFEFDNNDYINKKHDEIDLNNKKFTMYDDSESNTKDISNRNYNTADEPCNSSINNNFDINGKKFINNICNETNINDQECFVNIYNEFDNDMTNIINDKRNGLNTITKKTLTINDNKSDIYSKETKSEHYDLFNINNINNTTSDNQKVNLNNKEFISNTNIDLTVDRVMPMNYNNELNNIVEKSYNETNINCDLSLRIDSTDNKNNLYALNNILANEKTNNSSICDSIYKCTKNNIMNTYDFIYGAGEKSNIETETIISDDPYAFPDVDIDDLLKKRKFNYEEDKNIYNAKKQNITSNINRGIEFSRNKINFTQEDALAEIYLNKNNKSNEKDLKVNSKINIHLKSKDVIRNNELLINKDVNDKIKSNSYEELKQSNSNKKVETIFDYIYSSNSPSNNNFILPTGNKREFIESIDKTKESIYKNDIKRNKNNVTNQTNHLPKNYKTQLCRFFLSKSCTKGNDCHYSHDLKKFPCKAFHLRKNCRRNKCSFSHDPIDQLTLDRLKETEVYEKEEKHEFVSHLQFI